MKSFYRFAPLGLLLMMLAGCQSQQVGPSGAPVGTVTHVVIMWMYDPSDMTARHEILATGKTLEQIPGVLSVAGGRMLRVDRAVVDNSYDVAFVVTFKSEAAMRAYLENPLHAEAKKNVLDRYVKRYQVYDFQAE